MQDQALFGSMLMGGFECSTHQLRSRHRLDVIASSGHDVRAANDYRLLHAHGMAAARDGLRWHLIEPRPGQYDWSSFLPMLRAARDTGTTVVWDLLHYGTPAGVDIFSPRFITRFAAFAREAARVIASETDAAPLFTPVNEISFWAWAGGDTGSLNPFCTGRGSDVKRQLVRAALAAIAEVRAINPATRIGCAEPLIQVLPNAATAQAVTAAALHTESQYEALDMLFGRKEPELGGNPGSIDFVGLNFYYNNVWIDHGRPVYLGDWLYPPLHQLLETVAARYPQPLYIAETGTEGVFRPYWLRYICDEVRIAQSRGVPMGGICLYPVISHLGWDDDRHCHNGLFEGFGPDCHRAVWQPLADEVIAQASRFRA